MLRPGFKSCLQDSRAPAGLSKASLVSSLQPILVTTSAAGSVGCSLTDPFPQTPAACPTTELSSDSIRLELALDPTGEGLPPSQAQRANNKARPQHV